MIGLQLPSTGKKSPINALVLILINVFIPFFMSFFVSDKMFFFHYAFAGAILLLTHHYTRFLKYIAFLIVFFLVYRLTVFTLHSSTFRIFFSMLLMTTPSIVIATVIISDYNSSEILSSLSILRLPKPFIVALTVTLRYIPIFFSEYRIIKRNVYNRGIDVSWRQPLRYFEYLIVPQLFRSVDISRELAIAALTKGIKSEKTRTSYFYEGLRPLDYIVFGTYLTSTVLIAGKIL